MCNKQMTFIYLICLVQFWADIMQTFTIDSS